MDDKKIYLALSHRVMLLFVFSVFFGTSAIKAEVISVAIPWNCPQSTLINHPISAQQVLRISYDSKTMRWNDSEDLKALQDLRRHPQIDYTECLNEFNDRLFKHHSSPAVHLGPDGGFSSDYEKGMGSAFRNPPLMAGDKHQEFYPSNKVFYAAYATEMLFYCTGEDNHLYGNPEFKKREFQSPVLQAHVNNYNFELSTNLWDQKEHLEKIEKFLPADCKIKYLDHIKESAKRQKMNCPTEDCARQVERFIFKVTEHFFKMGGNPSSYLGEYREKILCEDDSMSSDKMKAINDLLSKNLSACIKLKDGETVLAKAEPHEINGPGQENGTLNNQFQLTKIPSKDPNEEYYQIGINLQFSYPLKVLLQALIDHEDLNNFELNKKMHSKVKSCFGRSNEKLTVDLPNGKKGRLSFQLMPSNFRPLYKIDVINSVGGVHRDSMSTWAEDIDCPTIIHEVLHWIGLKDEYNTDVDRFVKNKKTGEWERSDFVARAPLNKLIYNLTNKTIPVNNCRSRSREDSIMYNHQLAFKKPSILFPGQFRAITSRGCPYMNETFRKCTENAYKTTIGDCAIAPECQDPKIWLEK